MTPTKFGQLIDLIEIPTHQYGCRAYATKRANQIRQWHEAHTAIPHRVTVNRVWRDGSRYTQITVREIPLAFMR